MTPEQIKDKIQSAYQVANQNRNTFYSRNSGIEYIFRDIHLFGHEAGKDFAETFINEIVQEAVDSAKCRETSMTIQLSKSGKGGLDAIAKYLRDATGLQAVATHQAVTLTWVDDTPRMI